MFLMASVLLGIASAQDGMHVAVQGHRGFMSDYPENTLLSFARAFEAGADRVELDLAITADGEIVVMHDATTDRTTDQPGLVSYMTLAELQELDAGSWMHPSFVGERVPTLREVLELDNGNGHFNLEIKSRGRLWSQTQEVIKGAVQLIHELDAGDRVLFSSFEMRSLLEVREQDESLRLLLIDWDPPGGFDNLDLTIHHQLHAWGTKPEFATEERVRKAKEAGLYVHVGRADDVAMHDLVSWGVDQFGADDVASLVGWLDQNGYRNHSSGE